MTIVSLPRLLAGDRPADHVVATRHGVALSVARLRAEAARTCAQLQARGVRRGLLVCSDSFQFLVGMTGLLAAGAEIVLPPNARPGTLAGFAGAFDVLVRDESEIAGVETLVLDGSGSDLPLGPIDPRHARLDFFTSGSAGQSKRIEKTLAMLEREAAALDAVWGDEIGAFGDDRYGDAPAYLRAGLPRDVAVAVGPQLRGTGVRYLGKPADGSGARGDDHLKPGASQPFGGPGAAAARAPARADFHRRRDAAARCGLRQPGRLRHRADGDFRQHGDGRVGVPSRRR